MFHVVARYLVVACLLLVAADPVAAFPVPNIVVTSTGDAIADDGKCTLREAILAANNNTPSVDAANGCAAGVANPGIDVIGFAIPDTDSGCTGSPKVCTITPASQLPFITGRTYIDGYSQPGTSQNALAIGDDAVLLIELDVSNSNPGLRLEGSASSNSLIRGLVISHLAPSGILIADGSDGDAIAGNFIGMNVAGTASSGSGDAIDIQAGGTNATIGGTTPATRNLLGGTGLGVYVSASSGATIQGNYIGVERNGLAALTQAAQRGIQLDDGTGNALVGGAASGAGNLIGTWAAHAIIVAGSGANNVVQGNLVGTDAYGLVKFSAGLYGISFIGSGNGNRIGGTAANEGNIVAAAAIAGIYLAGSATDLLVQGNFIGTDVTGTLPLGNVNGIVVQSGSGAIGGTAAGAANRIAFNGVLGVDFVAGATGWAIEGNDIYGNASLGISLSGSGAPTPNDDGDADTGANNRQNYPVISVVTINPKTSAHVSGSLNSTASSPFRIEFFANANCDPSGHGQGKIYIGFADVMTVGNDVAFGPLDFTVPADRHVITATATDGAGNTSEFSACGTQDTIFSDGLQGD